MNTLRIAWHEFIKTLRTPSFYFVAALFLFYQGIVFSITVSLRHHPLSPPGPLLAPFFGGPFWFWPLLILVVVELSHGAISRERNEGTLELLLASPASPGAVVAGKYLGITALFSLLWLMTLPLVGLLILYLPAKVSVAAAPLVTGYLGAILVGAAGLALGIFFSSLTADTRLSGMLTFVVLFLLVLLKILVNQSYGIITSPALIKVLGYFNFLDYMETFARGNVRGVHLAILAGIIVLSVRGATLLIGIHQRVHRLWAAADFVILALILALITATAGFGDHTWRPDSRDIDPRLAERLDTLREPVTASLFTSGAVSNLHFAPLVQIENSLTLFSARSRNFSWRKIPIARPGLAARTLATRFGLKLENLQRDRTGLEEGVLVVEAGSRFKVIPLSTIVTADIHRQRIRFKGLRLEAELASALAFLADPQGLTLCVTAGHGEKSIASPGPLGLTRLMNGFKASGWSIRDLSPIPSSIPARCTLLFIPSPTKAFLPAEVEAVESHLLHQGGLVVTVDEEGVFPDRLARMLGRWNLEPTGSRVLDPKKSVGKTGGWLWAAMVGGTLAEKNWRVVLEGPRELRVGPSVQVLQDSSGEARRVAAGPRMSGTRGRGTAVVAAINGPETPGRVAVVGYTLPFLNRSLDERGESSDSAVELLRYLAGWGGRKTTSVPIPEMAIVHHHLNLKSSHITTVHLFSMLLWPLFAMSLGIWVAFRRRR